MQKKRQYIPRTPSTQQKTTANTTAEKPKPKVSTEHGVDFFTTNIADITKNDNTASYGSIVSAKPAGYKVVKDYFPAIAQNFRQRYLILHYTALPDDKSITVLTQQAVSAHYLVNNTGNNEIYQLVDENKRAYHAGVSAWRVDKNLNDTSIGIEIVNTGYTTDASGKRVFAPFDEAQIKKSSCPGKRYCEQISDSSNQYPCAFRYCSYKKAGSRTFVSVEKII